MALFRNEAPALGLGTTLQETSGYAGNPAGAPAVNAYKPTTRQFVDIECSAVSKTAANLAGWSFKAPWSCQVIGISAIAATPATSSMTITLSKMPVASQPAAPSGTGTQPLLAAALNLDSALTANTLLNCTLATTASNLILAPGDLIGWTVSGAATGMIGGNIQIEIVQLG